MFPPLNADTFAAFAIGMQVGIFLVACFLFVYGQITGYLAAKKNEQQLRDALQALYAKERISQQ